MLLKLAWRNIWRNKRRTYITAASILFAVLFASLLESLQEGAWDNMMNNVVNFYFGYGQIQGKGYWEDQSIDKAFDLNNTLAAIEQRSDRISDYVPRLESFALASFENHTSGALVVGIHPELEQSMTNIQSRISNGTFFTKDDKSVLVAEGLAEILNVKIKDTLVLISQGYHGVNSAGKYPVAGFVNFGSPQLNKQLIYLPLQEAQWFYGADGLVTSIALNLDDKNDLYKTFDEIGPGLNLEEFDLMDWKKLLPDLVEAKEFDDLGNDIVFFILYAIIAFGIFGTILMMTKEREFEFGILISIGMKRMQLAIAVWLEILMLASIGVVAGILASIPVVWYFILNPIRFTGDYAKTFEKFAFEPIMPAVFSWKIFLVQALIILLMTSIMALYPYFTIRKLHPVHAMRD